MSRGKDLVKNTGILMIAKISTQFVSFLLLPLYTALLTTEDYGRVDVYSSLSMLVIPFLTLQVEMALFRFFITDKEQTAQKEIVSSSYAIIGVMTATITGVFLVVLELLQLPHHWLLFGYYISQAFASALLQTCRAQGDNIGYGVATFISSALAVALNVLFVAVFHWRVEGIIAATIIAQSVSCVYMVVRTRVYRYLCIASISIARCRELMQYAVPLVFNQISSWAINYSNRLIIVAHWGEGINGIFSVASKFSNITGTFFNVYNVAWTENVVRSMDDPDGASYISRMFELTFNVYLVLVTGIVNVLPFVFDLMVNKGFHEAYLHVPVLLVGMLFSGMSATLGSIYIAYKKTKAVSATTALAGICNIVLHFTLLKACGLFAASISTLISFLLLFIYRWVAMKKFFELHFRIKQNALQLIVLLFAWAAYSLKNTWLILIGLMLDFGCIAILVKTNKDIISGMFRKVGK